MKLAAISHLASERAPTGAEKSLAHLATALAGRGHEVAVAAPGRWCLTDEVRGAGVEVVEIRARSCWLAQAAPQPAWLQALRYLRFRLPDPGRRRLMVWLDRWWPEVVYVNCLPQIKGASAARALGLPVVWQVREILPLGRRRRWFAAVLRRHADRIIAVSGAVEAWLIDEGLGDRTTVVYNGCRIPDEALGVLPSTRPAFNLPMGQVLLGFFAQLIEHKGVFDLVDAAAAAIARGADIGVVFAGDGQAADRLRTRIAATGHDDRFVVLPPRPDVSGLLAAVDVVVVPSRWPDPLPRTVMEAMAAGRPIIATRTGGIPEMVDDGRTGVLVDAGDVAGLAEAIIGLARESEQRSSLGSAGRRRIEERFTIDLQVGAVERVLADAAGQRQAHDDA